MLGYFQPRRLGWPSWKLLRVAGQGSYLGFRVEISIQVTAWWWPISSLPFFLIGTGEKGRDKNWQRARQQKIDPETSEGALPFFPSPEQPGPLLGG
jgi:hypothetical protein